MKNDSSSLICNKVFQYNDNPAVLILFPSLSIGLPSDGILTMIYEHRTGNHTITVVLQSGSERISAVFGAHRLSTEPPKSYLSVRLKHNVTKIKKHGIPFIVEAVGYYEVRKVQPII